MANKKWRAAKGVNTQTAHQDRQRGKVNGKKQGVQRRVPSSQKASTGRAIKQSTLRAGEGGQFRSRR
eukprot:404058-Pelagomonas_calceolata.AAC.2